MPPQREEILLSEILIPIIPPKNAPPQIEEILLISLKPYH